MSQPPSDSPSAAQPPCRRWENRIARRYYLAAVRRNLFGQWELWRGWGGIGAALGGQACDPTHDESTAWHALGRLARERERRGYVETTATRP